MNAWGSTAVVIRPLSDHDRSALEIECDAQPDEAADVDDLVAVCVCLHEARCLVHRRYWRKERRRAFRVT